MATEAIARVQQATPPPQKLETKPREVSKPEERQSSEPKPDKREIAEA